MDENNIKRAEDKLLQLEKILKSLGKAAVAFSGGVDSALLLAAAHKVLGRNVVAITAASHVIPQRELAEAEEFCRSRGIKQLIFKFDELEVPGFRSNSIDRCYHCKHALFTGLLDMAAAHGNYVLVEGSNMDDMSDYRPGLQALRELEVMSPLKEAGLTKAEVRCLSSRLGLPQWNKPSFACLASRFAYGEEITAVGLARVEKAENILHELGIRQFRVRVHGELARIEVLLEDMPLIMTNRASIHVKFKALGFAYVSLDLGGYSSGNMNIGLER